MATEFQVKQRYAGRIRWSARGSCGEPGCTDAECGCALCGLPVGVSEYDRRWETHDENCAGCELCQDQVPVILFRGDGKAMEQAVFHGACFEKAIFVKSGITTSTAP